MSVEVTNQHCVDWPLKKYFSTSMSTSALTKYYLIQDYQTVPREIICNRAVLGCSVNIAQAGHRVTIHNKETHPLAVSLIISPFREVKGGGVLIAGVRQVHHAMVQTKVNSSPADRLKMNPGRV